MIKRTLLHVTLLISLCAVAHAEQPAGILLYFKSGSEVYLLLADHATPGSKARGWGGFGGGAHSGETAAETAARESEEETRGFFTAEALLEKIAMQTPVVDTNGFALFFAETPFIPVQQVMNHLPDSDDWSYLERGPFAWIPFSEVQKHFEKPVAPPQKYMMDRQYLPAGSQSDWFWDVWIGNMRLAWQMRALPWMRDRGQVTGDR